MSIFTQFETDKKATNDGVWVSFGYNEDDTEIRFKLTRLCANTNKAFAKAGAKYRKPYTKLIEMDQISLKKQKEISLDAFADAILIDWENVQGSNGEIKYSIEAVKELMDALPDLYAALLVQANDIALFKKFQLEEDSKN